MRFCACPAKTTDTATLREARGAAKDWPPGHQDHQKPVAGSYARQPNGRKGVLHQLLHGFVHRALKVPEPPIFDASGGTSDAVEPGALCDLMIEERRPRAPGRVVSDSDLAQR
jgi:hypothetical protein